MSRRVAIAVLYAILLAEIPGAALLSDIVPPKVPSKVPLKALPFDLECVKLLDGPFRHAMDLDAKYVLSLDPDRLLHTFRLNAGLPSTAKPYGGWEEPRGELRGHFAGHYLTACALLYASTGDERFKAKGETLVSGLAECQAKIGSGYLSAYPEEFIDRVEALKPVWAPWYTLHKILAGLLDMYTHCGNAQALDTAKKFGDWVVARTGRLSDEKMQAMLGNEHGGINEAMANLYGLTGEPKYLKTALRLNHMAVISPAMKREDRLTGLHANTQIPKFIGTARLFELTGDPALRTASDFFWDTVANERSYVIGGHSDGEHFSPKEKLSEALGPSTTETCNTYNMLKLTRHLFAWDPKAEYADYYERALLNHILCSQNPDSGMMCYYVPLRSGSQKGYNSPEDSFWCCTGTGVENHAKYGDSIYFHDEARTLWVNLFIASELGWKARGLTLRQETSFPDVGSTRLSFTLEKPLDLELRIRRPQWAGDGFQVLVNGKAETTSAGPASFVALSRTWKTGDQVEVVLPMTLRTEGFRDNPRRFAFLHGPTVLAAQVDVAKPFPAVVVEPQALLGGFEPVAGVPSTFRSKAGVFRIPGSPESILTLEPFWKVHGGRTYIVYWDSFTPESWAAKEKEYLAEIEREKALEARTTDRILVGHEQSERDHAFAGERTGAGDFSGRRWRHAVGGWFSYSLAVAADKAQALSVTYWGSDGGNRVFDILVDGTKIATQRLEGNRPGKFYDEVYPLPAELTKGKARVTVKFQAHPGATAGGLFSVRVLAPETAK